MDEKCAEGRQTLRSGTSSLAGKAPKQRARRVKRILASAVLLLSLAGFAPPAHAGKVICVTAYYYKFNTGPHYVANNECFVPTTWTPQFGAGPMCQGDAAQVRICWSVSASWGNP